MDEILELKSRRGGDMMAYGGAEFVRSLILTGLIDEYHLFINPRAIGQGLAIFDGLEKNLHLRLVEPRAYECGIVVNTYLPQ